MSATDPHYVRAYRNERQRHLDAALSNLRDVAERSARLVDRWDSTSPQLISSEARRVFESAAAAYARAEAFNAVDDVSFLTRDPDAEG